MRSWPAVALLGAVLEVAPGTSSVVAEERQALESDRPAAGDLVSAAPADTVPPLPASPLARWTLPAGELGEGRRTLGALPTNLARSFVGVLSRDNLGPLLAGAGVSFTGHSLDGPAERAFESACLRCGRAGATLGGAAAMVPVVGAVFAAGRLAGPGPFREFSYDMTQAFVVNAAWTGVLKYSLHRQRPDGRDRLSLPSGHSSTAFSLATVAERHYGWKVGVPAYALATAIGLSRIESGRHHLSDVLAGATLGIVVGRTVTRLNGDTHAQRRLSIVPATDPQGGGIGLGVSASW